MSLMSYKGFSDDAPLSALELNITAMWEQLDNYGDENATINDKIVNFLMTEAGVTQEEIDSIRNIMLTDVPADYFEEEVELNNTVNNNTNVAQNTENTQDNTVIIIVISVCGIIVVGAIVVLVLLSKKKKDPEVEQGSSKDEEENENEIDKEKDKE